MSEDIEQKIKELTLLLLWLTSWEEKSLGTKWCRSWKGHDFDILNKLREEDLIRGSHKARSVILTEKGTKEAEKIKKKYLK